MRTPLLLALALLALVLPACKGKCRVLSEKLCECEVNSVEKDGCMRRASSEEARLAPSPEDEAICAQLEPGCDCHAIDTPEGKRACGLAR